MIEHLPADIRRALDEARKRGQKRRSRLRLEAGGEMWRVLRRWEGGVALDAAEVGYLRGLVDLYDGPRHLMQCLIVASAVEEGELICLMKSETPVRDRAPLDFARDDPAPAGYLPRP
ncbi:MAG: hypothetical protein H5U17_03705 [Defluviimonas sp.]|nr:hypothetical protein [Defluviimonas sp.]